MNSAGAAFISAEWPMSHIVKAGTTTRLGGVSQAPFNELNLGLHVCDDEKAVRKNRAELVHLLGLPAEPRWLNQNHGVAVCDSVPDTGECFDAAWTNQAGEVLAILTADCLPVVIASADGAELGAAHAGWRGLVDGVLSQLVDRFSGEGSELFAWLGPAIGPAAFEVGDEVKSRFIQQWAKADRQELEAAFTAGDPGKWYADLYGLAKITLAQAGVTRVYGGQFCTLTDSQRFYSFRRDGPDAGRMATLVWR